MNNLLNDVTFNIHLFLKVKCQVGFRNASEKASFTPPPTLAKLVMIVDIIFVMITLCSRFSSGIIPWLAVHFPSGSVRNNNNKSHHNTTPLWMMRPLPRSSVLGGVVEVFFRLLHPTTGLLKGFGHGAVTKL